MNKKIYLLKVLYKLTAIQGLPFTQNSKSTYAGSGVRVAMFGHEREPGPSACLVFIVTIDSNEMFGNEAIHQGVDTLATWCPKGPQKMPILYFSLVLGTIALGNFSSAWSDCF